MKEIVSKVRSKTDNPVEDVYTSKFESTKWICLAVALGSIFAMEKKYFKDPKTQKIVVSALLLVVDLTFELRRTEFTTVNLAKLRKVLLPNALGAKHAHTHTHRVLTCTFTLVHRRSCTYVQQTVQR